MTMTAQQWLYLALAAGLFGGLGQTLRMIAGLKKLFDEASAKGTTTGELIDGNRLLVSLLIGVAAGVLAALAAGADPSKLQRDAILGCIAAGYGGTDFIEAMMSRFLPGGTTPGVPPKQTASGSQVQEYAG